MFRIFDKSLTKDVFLSVVFSILISFITVLLFAFLVQLFSFSDGAIGVGNVIIKVISIFLGILFGVKQYEKGIIKGSIVGLFYAILSSLIFSLFAGVEPFYGFNLVDLLFGVISGVITGIIVVNIRK